MIKKFGIGYKKKHIMIYLGKSWYEILFLWNKKYKGFKKYHYSNINDEVNLINRFDSSTWFIGITKNI